MDMSAPVSEKVCAVVVTYNRKPLLRVCLETLLAQTRKLDFIFVVDNASNDGTLQMLSEEFPDLFVLKLPVNSGGAGGFHAGMKWAYEQGFDWIWVMDDDVRTLPNALETMLSYGHIGDLIHCRKWETRGMLVWEALWDVNACFPITFQSDVSFEHSKDWTSITYANFEGALMKRKVIEKTGLPDVRYFIAGDDSVYGFLASLQVHAIYINFVGLHKDLPAGRARGRFHYYFQLRNRFLTYEHFVKAGLPLRRSMFLLNIGLAAATLLREIITIPRERSLLNAKTVYFALVDGLRGRFGKPSWIS